MGIRLFKNRTQYCTVLPPLDMTNALGPGTEQDIVTFCFDDGLQSPVFHYYNFLAVDVIRYSCWLPLYLTPLDTRLH